MGNCASELKNSELYESSSGLKPGCTGMQGYRSEMEDTHVAIDIPSRPDHLLLAVFDGHGGKFCADFAAQNIVSLLECTDEWKAYCDDSLAVERLRAALIETFQRIDECLRAIYKQQEEGSDVGDVNVGGSESLEMVGCTAVVAIVTPTYIVCANAGDSRCVLGSNNETIPMSEDHKPTLEREKKRIVHAKGYVSMHRLNGIISVSRGFGDFAFKCNPDLSVAAQQMSCIPDITVHERTPEDEVLILACDGVWDVFSSDVALKHVRSFFDKGEKSAKLMSEELVNLSLRAGSHDNLSAIVLPLPGAKIAEDGQGLALVPEAVESGEVV